MGSMGVSNYENLENYRYAKTGNFQVYYADVITLSKRTKGAYQLIIIGQ